MHRGNFDRWGAHLDDRTFAQALAAVACRPASRIALGPLGRGPSRQWRRLAPDGFVQARSERVTALIHAIQNRRALPDPVELAEWWNELREGWTEHGSRRRSAFRLEIVADARRPEAGRQEALALLRAFQNANRDREIADSIYLRVDEPRRAVRWEWPVRLGVFGTADVEGALRDAIERVPWQHLIRVVDLDEHNEESDLLLVDADLRGTLARVMRHPGRIRTDCVLALRGIGVPDARAASLYTSIRSEVLCSGVGAVRIPPENLDEFVRRLVEELSHDWGLDGAINESARWATRNAPTAVPMLALSHELVERGRLSAFSRDLSKAFHLMAAAPPEAAPAMDDAERPRLKAFAAELARMGEDSGYLSEGGDATTIAGMRAAGEELIGRPLHAVRAARPDAVEVVKAPRHVNCRAFPLDAAGEEAPETRRIEPDRRYSLVVDIGVPLADAAVAPAFPEDQLPEREGGHILDVAFIPLVADASGAFPPAQQSKVWLPPTGRSSECRFAMSTAGVADTYRARLLVSHENRVMQSLALTAGLTGENPAMLALTPEVVTSPQMTPVAGDEEFDAAIVVNHSSTGDSGLTVLTGNGVRFLQPAGLEDLVRALQTLLSAEATFPEPAANLDEKSVRDLVHDLSRYGRSLMIALEPALDTDLPEGARVQVVEARAGSWLPAEILYRGPAVDDDAKMCPRAREALLKEGGFSHATCPHRSSSAHVCPLRFWGLSNVIERQPDVGGVVGSEVLVRVRDDGNRTLDVLRSALFGASARALKKDVGPNGPIQSALKSSARTVASAGNWKEWEHAIAKDAPTLLVLLPHSDHDPKLKVLTALEIGGNLLSFDRFDTKLVSADPTVAPLVLLLGCSTELPDTPFLNFVQQFKRHRASLVIGTLAAIRARRTAPFVKDLLTKMQQAKGSTRTFGQLFLETKRELLASGDAFALSLTMYGDVDWRL